MCIQLGGNSSDSMVTGYSGGKSDGMCTGLDEAAKGEEASKVMTRFLIWMNATSKQHSRVVKKVGSSLHSL